MLPVRPMWRLSWWCATCCWVPPGQLSGCCIVSGTRASRCGCPPATRCLSAAGFYMWPRCMSSGMRCMSRAPVAWFTFALGECFDVWLLHLTCHAGHAMLMSRLIWPGTGARVSVCRGARLCARGVSARRQGSAPWSGPVHRGMAREGAARVISKSSSLCCIACCLPPLALH